MIPIALLFLTASTHVDLVDEVFRIPAGEWRYVELGLRQRPAWVSAEFDERSGRRNLRLALMRGQDLAKLRDREPAEVLAATNLGASGRIEYRVRVPGEYVVVIDNRANPGHAADAHLHVDLDFGFRAPPEVRRLSRGRQAAVIAISFAVFLAIVAYSTRRLLQAIRH